jgi:hypothetical protein
MARSEDKNCLEESNRCVEDVEETAEEFRRKEKDGRWIFRVVTNAMGTDVHRSILDIMEPV